MGLFDIFTAAPARRAAEENTARLNQNYDRGTGILNTAQDNQLGALRDAAGAYQPLQNLAGQYGQGTTMRLNALGLNGAEGGQQAWQAFQTANPQTQGAIDAGLGAINRRRAGAGMLNSGNADLDALNFAQNTQNQQYGNWLSQLGALDSNNLAATGGAASGIAGANTNMAGVYGNTANNLVNLGNNTTSGVNSQATQSANAQMQGSGNLLNFGMNLASLAAGGMGGGGGLFGSFGGGQSMNSNPGNGAGGYTYPVYR